MTELCGPPLLKISWSALLTHEYCQVKARLYREKKKSPATDVRAFFRGTVADRTMRRWLEMDDPQPGWMVASVEEMIEYCLKEIKETSDGVVRWKHRGDRAEVVEWVRELLSRLEPFLLRDVIPYDYQPEYKFRIPIRIPDPWGNTAQILLTGGMDILVREALGPPAVWAGYDLKATENPDYLRKTLGQGIFYSLAHWASTGDRFRTFAFVQPMVSENPIAHITVTDADLATLMARITSMAHDVWLGKDNLRKETSGCAYCEVKHACPRFTGTSKTVFAPKRKIRPASA